MKSKILILFFAALLVSCASHKTLYSWRDYDITSYNYLKNNDDKSTKALEETYKKIIEKQKGTRNTVPPGIYADYGLLLIKANKIDEGKAMLQKEIDLYPESKIFVAIILKMFEK